MWRNAHIFFDLEGGVDILGNPPQCVFGIIAWSMKSNSLFKGSSLYGEGGGFPNNRKSREG